MTDILMSINGVKRYTMLLIKIEDNGLRDRLLAGPAKILALAKKMGADTQRAEKLFDELSIESLSVEEWFDKKEKMLDSAVTAIMHSLRNEFRKQGLGGFDVEKYFLSAISDLKKSTPESIRRAQESIKSAKMEAQRLEKMKKETVDIVLETETLLKDVKEVGKAWSSRNEYLRIEGSLGRILDALDNGNYELASSLSKSNFENAKALRDMRLIALRSAAKAGHVVGKLRTDGASVPKEEFKKLNTFLSAVKYLLEDKDYKTAMLLAKEAKHEAEKLLPSDKTSISTFVCPLCFDIKCPNPYCNMSISSSPSIEETCRTYCDCGTFYHICCVQKGEDLICASCHTPLKM
jgi:hypothetical protein